jgi:pyrroline-5-carboxylate reductase
MTYELGILGAGNMAEAIVRGALHAGALSPQTILAADSSEARRRFFEESLHIRATPDNAAVARSSRVLLVSVKPQQVRDVLGTVASSIDEKTMLISIAAGISTASIASALPSGKRWRVIRAMPNTPMLIGVGMTAVAPGAYAQPQDVETARKLFGCAGDVIEVPESQIDAVTAMSGSGPAYFFYAVEQMTVAGVELGFDEPTARRLATATALGAARMMCESTDTPQVLRRKVTSPGGTTEAALKHLEAGNWGPILRQAIAAAHRRARQLGE